MTLVLLSFATRPVVSLGLSIVAPVAWRALVCTWSREPSTPGRDHASKDLGSFHAELSRFNFVT